MLGDTIEICQVYQICQDSLNITSEHLERKKTLGIGGLANLPE